MDLSLSPPAGLSALAIVALALAAVLGAVLPTCLYLYVEPRGRRQWGTAGQLPSVRRAPALVRLTAWLSFSIAQAAIPWLLVPAACGVLLYGQLRLGVGGAPAIAVTGALGLAALAQCALSASLLPLGVRLLARDPRAVHRARSAALTSAALLGGALLVGWAMSSVPGFIHPVLRATLEWTALRPVMILAGATLAHALLLGRCAPILASDPPGREP